LVVVFADVFVVIFVVVFVVVAFVVVALAVVFVVVFAVGDVLVVPVTAFDDIVAAVEVGSPQLELSPLDTEKKEFGN
jgi:nitrate/nitrite-specific signal transduction histidine kinase